MKQLEKFAYKKKSSMSLYGFRKNKISEDVFDFMISYLPFPQK